MEVQAGDRQVYAIDLLGYGYSDKPNPRLAGPPSSLYNFDTWSDQLLDFTRAVIGRSAVLSCNSVGGLAGLQAAVKDPAIVRAVQVINISLRALHLSKQAAWKRPAVSTLQRALRTTGAGPWLFKRLATRDGVRRVLQTCYGDPKTVTDELVDYILKPGLEPGAVEVFLDFISYSSGPLPEDLLQACKVPVSILWGEADPWEPVKLGRTLALYPSVEEWASLPGKQGVGHCPQDEAPDQVNPFVTEFMRRHGGDDFDEVSNWSEGSHRSSDLDTIQDLMRRFTLDYQPDYTLKLRNRFSGLVLGADFTHSPVTNTQASALVVKPVSPGAPWRRLRLDSEGTVTLRSRKLQWWLLTLDLEGHANPLRRTSNLSFRVATKWDMYRGQIRNKKRVALGSGSEARVHYTVNYNLPEIEGNFKTAGRDLAQNVTADVGHPAPPPPAAPGRQAAGPPLAGAGLPASPQEAWAAVTRRARAVHGRLTRWAHAGASAVARATSPQPSASGD
ncbi:hypothetical protein F751_5959 [Auxenochlorella protothecoides]|uniref:Uncharacterized protein n=1 Tax=Auxenochlorella protothecoides TaxID=3075 RepID=A0A087SI64_AUXPR|nr:hypothetical protein F751_5959 [Auxenochlorella protothecoides]KFM25418.1 hypothetical protein F751_5959 [Auxenochlorella protothecoides]